MLFVLCWLRQELKHNKKGTIKTEKQVTKKESRFNKKKTSEQH